MIERLFHAAALVRRALTADFSWSRSAQRYAALYTEAQTQRLEAGQPD